MAGPYFARGFTQRSPLRIALLAGGESAEREISLQSGAAVAAALRERGHAVTQIDPRETDLTGVPLRRFDVVFLALHGRFGEDGSVQRLLEEVGVPYTGSDSTASRLAFSKSASKERFAQHNVPTPAYVLIHESDDAVRIQRQARKIGYPLIVKPDTQGSSLGVSLVASPDDLPPALARCFHYDAFGLLESAIAGTEWTVGLLDDLVLPPIRIESPRPLFDFDAKYRDALTRYHFEFTVPSEVVRAVEDTSRRAAQALVTRGVARVDLRLDKFDQPWVLEVNTIPGLTDHSLIPKAAARLGMDFGDLCERAVQSALPGTVAGAGPTDSPGDCRGYASAANRSAAAGFAAFQPQPPQPQTPR